MKATIIAIGKCRKNSPEKQLIDEYIKRSGWEVTIKEHDNASQEEEAKFLLSSIPAGAKAVVLDERGENMKSLELAAELGVSAERVRQIEKKAIAKLRSELAADKDIL